MFENTSVDKKHIKDIANIDDNYVNSGDRENRKYLKSKLEIEGYLLIAYNSWFKFDDGLYFFKTKAIFNELFLSELIKEYKIRCVDYSLASFKNKIGIISKSFRSKDKKYYEYNTFFNYQNMSAPKRLTTLNHVFREILPDKNRINLMDNFYRLTAFDWFTGQNDRTVSNIVFEVGDDVKLAPLSDNGSSLLYIKEEDSELEKYYRIYMSSFDHLLFPKDDKLNRKTLYLINLINNHLEFYRYLCKSLDIDINKILDRVIEKYNLIVPLEDREQLIKYFDKKKQILERTLSIANKHK
ncbi:MAG: hypothetical protein IJK67_05820 [Bacilli bacterium]|nr:hypothetical protein [Bacilli bacterium]